ncbi:MAG: amidophosphoribosyltransferase [Candidatus Aminicenantes bacterium]|nr:amidophosphoribosyltransferase [Candidatus Aminicenantes bacterium]
MCGVLGIYSSEPVIGKLYNGLLTLQHRGQDSAGILTFDDHFHLKKGNGLVRDIFDERHIERLKGNVGIAHTRYPTVGVGSAEDSQPFWINHPYGIAAVHNGNVMNFLDLKKELFAKSHKIINSNNDVEVILNIFAEALEKTTVRDISPENIFSAVRHVFKKVKGAYSVILHIANRGMVAFRDPFGVRPLLFGIDRRAIVPGFAFASESVSLDLLGFSEIRDVPPGSVVYIDQNRTIHEKKLQAAPFRPCIFEYIYFARPDSYLNKINVYQARVDLGKKLARQIKASGLKIDVVVPVPDSSRPAAIEIARSLKLKYREGLVKNRYIGRTFIMPGDHVRAKSIRHKLNPIADVFQGKDVLLVDDSIVRGNTSRLIIQMVRQAGAKKVYFASYSAPLTNPCVYGIDMQTKAEFVAAGSTLEEIAAKIGADRVIYLDILAMERAVKKQNPSIHAFCKACFSGKYPSGDVSENFLVQIEKEREQNMLIQRDLTFKY